MILTNDPQEQPDECDSCGFTTQELKAYEMYRGFPQKTQYKWLCELCASTPAGNAYEYPEQFHDRPLMQTVCYVGNAIIAAIKARP